jgi:hypothetical protein
LGLGLGLGCVGSPCAAICRSRRQMGPFGNSERSSSAHCKKTRRSGPMALAAGPAERPETMAPTDEPSWISPSSRFPS